MERIKFLKQSLVTGSFIASMDINGFIEANAQNVATPLSPVVSIAASNDFELTNPAPLNAELTTDQVRNIVWLALDRDKSSKNLRNIVKKDSWVVIKPNIVRIPGLPKAAFHGTRGLKPRIERYIDGLALVTDLRVVKAI